MIWVNRFFLGGVYLLHDNTKPHISSETSETITDLGFSVLPHLPYSPGIAPSDYYLLKHLQLSLKDKQSNKDDEVKNHVLDFFHSKSQSFFEKGIKELPNRWQ